MKLPGHPIEREGLASAQLFSSLLFSFIHSQVPGRLRWTALHAICNLAILYSMDWTFGYTSGIGATSRPV